MKNSFEVWLYRSYDFICSGKLLNYELIKFPGGELQPRLEDSINCFINLIVINGNLISSDSIMELMLLVDAIRRTKDGDQVKICFICPYLAYARQDRVCVSGEPLSIKVMCDLLNSLHFTEILVYDIHNEASLALLNNVTNIHQKEFVKRIGFNKDSTILVSPDAGAVKKVFEVAKELQMPVVRADKVRDVNTGAISGTVVYSEHIGNKDFLIVDDILDGGATFNTLALELRKKTTGKIFLYVTHGIFSKGLDVFNGLIDKIYTANPFPDVDLTNPILTVLR
jgi:ribose-phosphate pyrophosphokinase